MGGRYLGRLPMEQCGAFYGVAAEVVEALRQLLQAEAGAQLSCARPTPNAVSVCVSVSVCVCECV